MVALLETLLWEPPPAAGLFLWDAHVDRLRRTAAALGWADDAVPSDAALADAVQAVCTGPVPLRVTPRAVRATVVGGLTTERRVGQVRLTVGARVEATATVLVPLPVRPGRSRPVVVVDVAVPVDPADPTLAHKTTARVVYDAARARCGVGTPDGPADVLLTNTDGHVTEASIGNVLVDASGHGDWITPPCHCGRAPRRAPCSAWRGAAACQPLRYS
jgi:4-amino-4-deoxychorismate lyase